MFQDSNSSRTQNVPKVLVRAYLCQRKLVLLKWLETERPLRPRLRWDTSSYCNYTSSYIHMPKIVKTEVDFSQAICHIAHMIQPEFGHELVSLHVRKPCACQIKTLSYRHQLKNDAIAHICWEGCYLVHKESKTTLH